MMIFWLVHFTNDCGELIVQNLDMMFFFGKQTVFKIRSFWRQKGFSKFFYD